MIDNKKPEIIVIAGPNGSGKTTITSLLQITCEYINADNIKKSINCSDIEAAIKATEMREKLLLEKKDFAFETVLSTDRNIDLLRTAKDNGYFIRSFFMITKTVDINILRIKSRINKGGHSVPSDKVIKRYYKSINNLKRLIEISDVCNVYDNTNSSPKRIFKKRKEDFFYETSKFWDRASIVMLTGIENAINIKFND